jgi:hypothetical protein
MGKRVDNDATQDVSTSQLVPDAKPPGYPSVPKNDASMWMQSPVSADDFMGAAKKPKAKKNPASPDAGARRLVIGLIVVFFVATVGLGGYWAFFNREAPKQAPAIPAATTLPPPATPPLATTLVDAAVATAPADAGVPDASVPAEAAALQVDAVSAADPAIKKSKKRPTAKKKTAKKKTATAPKRR